MVGTLFMYTYMVHNTRYYTTIIQEEKVTTLVTRYNGLCRSKNIATVVAAVGRQSTASIFQTFVDLPGP